MKEHYLPSIQNIAFEKFVNNPAFKFLMSIALEYIEASITKKENGTADEDDERRIAICAQLKEAIETLENDLLRLYAENAAIGYALEQSNGKACRIIFEDNDQDCFLKLSIQ